MSRIAFISTMDTAPWGGSEELWSRTALLLAKQGYVVGANVWRWPQPIPQIDALRSAGCQVQTRRTIRRLRSLFGDRLERGVVNWLGSFRPDLAVLSLSYHTEGVAWMQECRRRNIPYALIVQSAGEPFWPDDSDAAALAECYEAAQAAFFVSQGNIDFVRTQLAAVIASACVVRNPFQVNYDAAPPWPVGDDVFSIACVGRLQSMAKGHDLLFSVLRQDKWKNRQMRVSVYGKGPNEATLRKLKDLWRLENVEFAGFSSDIEALWAQHHALIVPSRYEGLPLVIVEAMLCGRPCIVTDVSGNAELIEDNVSGFVADAATARALDEALERAWERRDEWQTIGRCAAQRVRQLVPEHPPAILATEIATLVGRVSAMPTGAGRDG